MNIFTSLRLSAIVLLSFLFTASYAQEEKDYFITVWDLSLDASANSSIEFWSLTTGDVNYNWETIPSGQSGSGKFTATETQVTISNLPVAKTIKLKLVPQNLKRFYFENTNNIDLKLLDVNQWGKVEWGSMEKAFRGCNNLNITATDLPNLSNVKCMAKMFYSCNSLIGPQNINQWNTASVTKMSEIFSFTQFFNQPIGNWNTARVTNMNGMFRYAVSFNQPIGNWSMGSVKDFYDLSN